MIAPVFVVGKELANHIERYDLPEVRFSKQPVDRVGYFCAPVGRTICAHPRIVIVTVQASEGGRIYAGELRRLGTNNFLVVLVWVSQ